MPAPFFQRSLPLLMAAACLPALAQEAGSSMANGPSVYLQGSWAQHGGADAITLGATLPWSGWSRPLWGGELRGHWDVYASRWSFDAQPGGHGSLTLLGVTPTLRLRMDEGRSAWFWEAGVGATLADRRYRSPDREFSTTFNFASHLGIGVNLGEQRRHELLLRVQHVSNAGIKHPNPGENFLQLRYAMHF